EGRTISDIAVIEARRGRPEAALALYPEAMQLHAKARDRSGEALTVFRMGEAYAFLKRDQEAKEAYERSQDLYRAVGSLVGPAQALAAIGQRDGRAGRPAEARAHVDQAIRLIESMRARISRLEDRSLFFSTWQETYRLSVDLYLDEHAASPAAGFD